MKGKINKLFDSKKKKITAIIISVCILIGGCIGIYAMTSGNDSKKKNDTKEVALEKLTEDDIRDYVAGIDDVYVVQGAQNLDFLSYVVVDSKSINKVEVDTDGLDINTAGDYTITYTVTVNTSKKAFKNKTECIGLTRTVHVVDAATAQSMADSEQVVYTNDMTVLTKSSGETIEIQEETTIKNAVKAESNNESKNNTSASNSSKSTSSDTNKNNNSNNSNSNSNNSSSSSNNSSGSNNSSNTSKNTNSSSNNNNSSNQTNNTAPSKPTSTHTHDWKPVYKTVTTKDAWDETVVVKAAWDETVYEIHIVCKKCGKDFGKGDDAVDQAIIHSAEFGHSYKSTKIQVDAIHHPAETKVAHHDAETKQEIDYYRCSCGATK